MRDGSQTEGVSFSTEDKLEILQRLDDFGIDFVEGGWPSSNPKDDAFFKAAQDLNLRHTNLVAFGSTRRHGIRVEEDDNIRSLLGCGTEWVCIFGKSWDLHVEKALGISLEENLEMVRDSVAHLVSQGRKVIFDAEHYLDGWKLNHDYALSVIRTAVEAGAEWIVLCDTNGGSLPSDVREGVVEVMGEFDVPVGVHAHNDSELAVANSLEAVEAGARMIQGTINGLGERCGNANLCSIIPDLELKMTYRTGVEELSKLRSLSIFVGETANARPTSSLPFVGSKAFAHKGGVHVSAISKDSQTYEHIDPALVGNHRRILISELAGTASILEKVKEFGIDEGKKGGREILDLIKRMEAEGFQFEGAEASFELLVRRFRNEQVQPFELKGFRLFIDRIGKDIVAEASVKVTDRKGDEEHTAAEGAGPVNALDKALRKALGKFYPKINEVRLTDYKVRVIDEKAATAARVRVLIRSTDGEHSWTTVGVSENIIEASLMALVDSMEYVLMKEAEPSFMTP